ncbi:MAG: dockerin type I repeat-containing protein, partial [Oscillospiraceae bacterium]|nr:dockerin type I repeat-containing protein [Oscillospiraceae bacterium]
YLDSSAPGAVNSAAYSGVTAKTDAEIKDAAFAAALGDAYEAVSGGYPVLVWQTSAHGAEPSSNTLGLVRSDESTTKKAVFDLAARIPLSGVNLIEAEIAYDASQYDVSVAGAVDGAAVSVVRDNGAGLVQVVVGVTGGAKLGYDARQVLAKIAVTPKAGRTPAAAYVEISSCKAYEIGKPAVLAADPAGAESAFTYTTAETLDANGDDTVTAADLSLVLYYFGAVSGELPQGVKADVNNDGTVTMIDVTLLVNALYPAA